MHLDTLGFPTLILGIVLAWTHICRSVVGSGESLRCWRLGCSTGVPIFGITWAWGDEIVRQMFFVLILILLVLSVMGLVMLWRIMLSSGRRTCNRCGRDLPSTRISGHPRRCQHCGARVS